MSRLVVLVMLGVLCACGGPTEIAPSFGDGGTCTDTWSGFPSGFFPGTCGSCHGQLRTHSGVQANAASMRQMMVSGRMPPNGVSASDEQRAVLYLDCGAP